MTDLSTLVNPDGMVSSKLIADKFQRRHADVLSSIRKLRSDLTEEFSKRTFSFVENTREIQRGEFSEAFMTRDGFALLAMGFNGKAALQWKCRFLEAFNLMEETVRKEVPALKAKIATRVDNLTQRIADLKQSFEEMRKVLDSLTD